MSSILIAFNDQPDLDNPGTPHTFFGECGEVARQECVNHNKTYHWIHPPHLTEQTVIGAMENYQLCVIAAHGSPDGILNEKYEEVISVKTTNYNFNGKGLYCISCSCASNLYPHLEQLGLSFFVGYNSEFKIQGDIEPFVTCAISGLKNLLAGDTIGVAKKKMLESFDEQISKAPLKTRIFLLNNKESLVFEGKEDLLLSELK